MLSALIIVFREMLEAGLILGVVLAATRGLSHRLPWLAGGVALGIAGALVVAVFAEAIAGLFDGAGQELVNAAILLLAVLMLAWHNAWMASHGREMTRDLKTLGAEVAQGTRPLRALAIVCGVAVMREGSEVVLFLYGVASAGGDSASDILIGGLLGLAGGAAVSALLYLGLISIPMRYLFGSLSLLISLLAAGLAAQAVTFLQSAGYLMEWTDPLWDTSWILSQDSMVGRVLHTLIGYFDRPDGMELAAYVAALLAMLALKQIASPRQGALSTR
ncbi:high-affinity iron transporter [Rhizobium sp. SG_E_25_P2]|uniref:FTR1 family iron permease n=1 Tax=Rhizobium sp. SG_E_25_P2 TaxID=2879942 RepID=UPI002473DCB1|nr:FTR1 family protein [Rhizobium sp. SG_E_25_P2]MDH6267076.1 high-affinity iron transporter [Rhizobium sp. SG_E_25_P2]